MEQIVGLLVEGTHEGVFLWLVLNVVILYSFFGDGSIRSGCWVPRRVIAPDWISVGSSIARSIF